jgi:hypothetical protein
MLDKTYTDSITAEDFAAKLDSEHWSLESMVPVSSYSSEDFCYIVEKAIVKDGGLRRERVEVLFFRKNGGSWKLLNFPFSEGAVPNFWVVPKLDVD